MFNCLVCPSVHCPPAPWLCLSLLGAVFLFTGGLGRHRSDHSTSDVTAPATIAACDRGQQSPEDNSVPLPLFCETDPTFLQCVYNVPLKSGEALILVLPYRFIMVVE